MFLTRRMEPRIEDPRPGDRTELGMFMVLLDERLHVVRWQIHVEAAAEALLFHEAKLRRRDARR